ncbi:hypothetical protein [Stakelama pacifica]|uniref:Uncharacterized protein n=1 Tax=Stakelama pacifica TaxID=517720 RepID=A0A4R6FKE5_9SPHN|nr:hypothetical protein [Stakelama pacifica]TDN81797.1 hypothetical protein EV664_107199 [Stakelama pacifica]GGO96597.1 hypothetical protein GCM10011329_23500 [Stakelama pacifica]
MTKQESVENIKAKLTALENAVTDLCEAIEGVGDPVSQVAPQASSGGNGPPPTPPGV